MKEMYIESLDRLLKAFGMIVDQRLPNPEHTKGLHIIMATCKDTGTTEHRYRLNRMILPNGEVLSFWEKEE